MKSTQFSFYSVCVLVFCGAGNSLFARPMLADFSETPVVSGFQLVVTTLAMVAAHRFITRQRKSRVPVPIKSRRKDEVIIVRRRNGQW